MKIAPQALSHFRVLRYKQFQRCCSAKPTSSNRRDLQGAAISKIIQAHNQLRNCRRLRTIGSRPAGRTRPERLQTHGRFRLKSPICRGRDTNAREDAIPHERGLLPVPPSDFCCTAIADPKARFCCPPPANRHPSPGNPPIPLTREHLTSR